MYIDLQKQKPSAAYFTIIQTVMPRPVAWILSPNRCNGGEPTYNLAPFSYFCPVCSDPPLAVVSIGIKPDGSSKDTLVNVSERRFFTIHIAHKELLDALNATSANMPYGVSEAAELGLDLAPFEKAAVPRLKAARIAFACELERVMPVGHGEQKLIFARLQSVWIDDETIIQDTKGRLKVDASQVSPIARLGGGEYAYLGEVLSLKRPD